MPHVDVRNRRAIGQWQLRESIAEELDELAHDALLAEHLGDREHEVGRRRSLGERAGEPHADHLRDQHRDGLSEHRGLGLDASDAPAQHAEPIDHRGVRVGSHECVGVNDERAAFVALHYDARQVLEVDLMHDAGVRRHHFEVAKRGLPPFEKLVAFSVSLKLELRIDLHRVAGGERVHLDRVVDDELHRLQRIDLLRLPSERSHRVAHRRQVDDRGDTGEILQEHARGRERDLP